jgi:hypothetical protein
MRMQRLVLLMTTGAVSRRLTYLVVITTAYPSISRQKRPPRQFAELMRWVRMYSKGICLPFVEAACAALPRELRDMVWTYLLDDEKTMKKVEEYLQHTVKAEVNPAADHVFLVQAGWIGEQAAREILEPLYKKAFKTFACKDRGVSVLHSLTMDVCGAGLTPMRFVKKLEVFWEVEGGGRAGNEALRDPGHWRKRRRRDFIRRPSWKACFESLLQMPDPSLFSMHFRIFDMNISTEHLALLLEAFEPVYEHLVASGSRIQIFYCHCPGCLGSSHAVLDLTRYIGLDMEVWRGELEDRVSEWTTGANLCRGGWTCRSSRDCENWVEYDPEEYDSDVLSVDDNDGHGGEEDDSDTSAEESDRLSPMDLSDID